MMILLIIAGVTGSVLVFRTEIDAQLNPAIRLVTPQPPRLSLSDLVTGIEAKFIDARVSTVTLPSGPDRTLIAYLAARPKAAGGTGLQPAVSDVIVNPYTGAILNERRAGGQTLERRGLISFLVRLHYTLLLGSTGAWIMGIAAIVWLLTTFIGVALAWPSLWLQLIGWVQTFVIRRDRGGLVFNYDLHRTLGVLLLPVWIPLAFSSIYLAFPNMVRSATATFSSVTAAPLARTTWSGGPIVSPDFAVAAALAAVPSATPFGFTRDFANGRYSVRLVLPGDVNPAGNSQAYIEFSTGKVTALRLASEAPGGLRFLYWQFPLHDGEAFGLTGRLLVAVSGLALAAMCASGCYVWWCGLSARRRH